MDCIDTWLLSHSTCPLCRSSLLLDYGGGNGIGNHGCSPIVCVLESSDSVENSREIERVTVSGSNSHLCIQSEVEYGSGQDGFPRKSCEKHEEKIVNMKLGNFRNNEGTSENENSNSISGGNNDLGSRRCYSMGSFAYILDETTSLQVPIRNTPTKKQASKNPSVPLRPGNRAVMLEYGCDSQREFNGIEAFLTIDKLQGHEKSISQGNGNGNGDERSKRNASFSISKIWERNKKGNDNDVSELGGDEETQSCNSVDSLAYPTTSNTSTTRRTLLWLMGRQNKIFHNHSTSFSSNV